MEVEEDEEDEVVAGFRRGCWWGEVGLRTDCVQRRKKPHEKRGRGGALGFGFWFALIIAGDLGNFSEVKMK